ncbi:Hypothetical protein D9617_18g033730 [Elsinoe fawcettii]|nr:Hypothetical protein D9617_18g033730 [Elsinoe fawcettii]
MASELDDVSIARYLDHIGMPAPDLDLHLPLGEPNLVLLTVLFRNHIAAIPYENLCLHYSRERYVSLDSSSLLDRIVSRRRGGYCMELNMIFYLLLRRIGFQAYMTGARLGQDPESGQAFTGWRHSIIIVSIPGSDAASPANYMVDVGFGGDGPITPIPLVHNIPLPNLGSQETRLTFGAIPDLSPSSPDMQPNLWSYWTRNSSQHPWRRQFCFSLLEFTLEDFKVMSYFASTHKESVQTRKLMVVKFLSDQQRRPSQDLRTQLSRVDSATSVNDSQMFSRSQKKFQRQESRGCRITGKLILIDDTLKINHGGRSQVLQVCSTEEERIAVLKDHFDITVKESEQQSISGSPVELPSGGPSRRASNGDGVTESIASVTLSTIDTVVASSAVRLGNCMEQGRVAAVQV